MAQKVSKESRGVDMELFMEEVDIEERVFNK